MTEEYEDYLEEVTEIATTQYDISTEEIVYNNEHFEQCFEEGTTAEEAVKILSGLCL